MLSAPPCSGVKRSCDWEVRDERRRDKFRRREALRSSMAHRLDVLEAYLDRVMRILTQFNFDARAPQFSAIAS